MEGITYAAEEYRGIEIQRHAFGQQTWRVFDKPDDLKLMITPTNAVAAGAGLADAATLGATRKSWTLAEEFEPAASDFLKARGCTITGGRLVLRTQYEFTYQCA